MRLFDLTGRVAIVTGGNGGIGLGMARGLCEAGAHAVLVGRNREKGEQAAAGLAADGLKASFIEADVTDEAACKRTLAEVVASNGGVDILINNAGIAIRKQPEEYTLAEWHAVLDTNLTSAFIMSQAVHASMKARGGGKIISIGSVLALFGAPFAIAYSSSKGGLVQFTKALATAGHRVARFEFSYMAARRTGERKPPPKAETVMPEYVAAIDDLGPTSGPLIIGGKSMGGRVASMIADAEFAAKRIAGLLCLGYPFHPLGRPAQLRTKHLIDMKTPALIVQGTRDEMGNRFWLIERKKLVEVESPEGFFASVGGAG